MWYNLCSLPMSLFEQFKTQRETRPDEAAFLITSGDRSIPISWRTFARDIEIVGWVIQHHAPGATIALLGANSYEWVVTHAACVFAGAIALPLEPGLTAEEIAERMMFTGSRILLHSAAFDDKAHEVKNLLPRITTGGFGTRITDRVVEEARRALEHGDKGLFDLPPRDENDTVMLVFTSGTTSKPRGAELSLKGIRTFGDVAAERLPMRPGQRTLMLLPLHHIFGLSATYMMLGHGVAMGVCPDFRHIYEAVVRFRVDFLCLVPALSELLASKINRNGRTAEEALGAPLDWILSGGAPLPPRTRQHLESLGIHILQAYGLTETTAVYSIEPYDAPRPGCVGKSCQGINDMETSVSATGELLLRGPAVMKGYYHEPERTAAAIDADGWFHTGDLGSIDKDGYVWITGRISRTIILSSGKKIAPEELEEKILATPGIKEVIVRGDTESRELTAEIYATISEEAVHEQIDFVNKKLPLHKRIRKIVMRSEPFPRTASGKIQVGRPSAAAGIPAPAPVVTASLAPRIDFAARAATEARRVLTLLRWRRVALTLVALAGILVVWSLVQPVVLHHMNLSESAHHALERIEECGEFILYLLVLLGAIALWRTGIFKVLKQKKNK